MVQLREKGLPAKRLLELALRLQSITSDRALLFINDRVDVALDIKADGVQLPENGLPVEAVRRLDGRLLVGRSVHTTSGGAKAEAEGADFLIAGSVFKTTSHPNSVAGGLGLINSLVNTVNIPVIGIGGIDTSNVESVMRTGASGVAVVTAITESVEPEQTTRQLTQIIKGNWNSTAHSQALA